MGRATGKLCRLLAVVKRPLGFGGPGWNAVVGGPWPGVLARADHPLAHNLVEASVHALRLQRHCRDFAHASLPCGICWVSTSTTARHPLFAAQAARRRPVRCVVTLYQQYL